MAGSGFLGCGTIYFNREVNGVASGWKEVGNSMKFAIKSNSTLKERKSKKCNSYGQTVDSVSIADPSELSINLDTIDKTNLAIAFLGNDSTISVTAGTITDESIVAPDQGAMLKTMQGNISAVVITDATATTTYAAGTDYNVINEAVGLIEIVEGGGITAGEVLLVDYANGVVTASKVTGGTESQIKVGIMMVGKNLVNNTGVVVEVWKATVSPTSEIDFLADDFSAVELTGRIELDEVKGNGFEVQIDRVAT